MDNRKFKVGDEITNGRDKVTITGISDDRYIITSEELEAEDSYTDNFWYISFSSEDKWELGDKLIRVHKDNRKRK